MVHFKKEEKEKHLIEYEVTVEEEKVREAMENIYREASRRISVPGFRKGRAPRNILKAHLNQNYIQNELPRRLVPEALQQVLKDENITLFGEPDIEVVKVSEDQPLVFKALVLEKPQTGNILINEHSVSEGIRLVSKGSTDLPFTLHNVRVGIGFHWDHRESQK